MKRKQIGTEGLKVSEIGLGCMGMSEFYGKADDKDSLRTLDRALELGVNFWDTADMYGPFHNEELIGKAIKGRRQLVTIATKFGIVRDPKDPTKRGLNGSPDYVKKSCEGSLKRLGTDVIDLYYLHRLDPDTPIEETVTAMAKLITEGKVRSIGLSEVAAETLRRAHAVHPITAIQSEYSLWSRDPENGVLDVCKELNIGFVAYSPLGRGFLTGQIRKFDDFAPDDFRRNQPRFQGENFNKNLDLVKKIEQLAEKKGCTITQLALAWVMAQGDFIVPIPGTKRIRYLEQNVGSLDVTLSKNDLEELESIAPQGAVSGNRYTDAGMKIINR